MLKYHSEKCLKKMASSFQSELLKLLIRKFSIKISQWISTFNISLYLSQKPKYP